MWRVTSALRIRQALLHCEECTNGRVQFLPQWSVLADLEMVVEQHTVCAAAHTAEVFGVELLLYREMFVNGQLYDNSQPVICLKCAVRVKRLPSIKEGRSKQNTAEVAIPIKSFQYERNIP